MKLEEFDRVVERRIGLIRQVLGVKAGEYATEADRLHNFKQGAALLRVSPSEACLSYMSKHLVSVIDLVKSGNATQTQIDEKVGDAINYLILLEATEAEARTWRGQGPEASHWLTEKDAKETV